MPTCRPAWATRSSARATRWPCATASRLRPRAGSTPPATTASSRGRPRPSAAPAAGAPLDTFEDPRFEAYSDVFNRYGAWETDPQYGAVWYPTVGADWRPYTAGYWHAYGPESQWLWVGRDPFGWPTHHYGRWGMNNGGRWYWMPGRQWAPAWVSWSVGPGYIGWSPLGNHDRPVRAWDTLSQPRGVYPGGTLDPSRAWTVVPSDHFGQRGHMSAYAVDPRTLDNLSAFVSQRVGPPARYGYPAGGYWPVLRRSGGTTVYGPGGYYGGVRSRSGGEHRHARRRSARPGSARPRLATAARRRRPRIRTNERSVPSRRGAASVRPSRTPPPRRSRRRQTHDPAPPAQAAPRQRTPPREAPPASPPPAARETAPPHPAAEPPPAAARRRQRRRPHQLAARPARAPAGEPCRGRRAAREQVKAKANEGQEIKVHGRSEDGCLAAFVLICHSCLLAFVPVSLCRYRVIT